MDSLQDASQIGAYFLIPNAQYLAAMRLQVSGPFLVFLLLGVMPCPIQFYDEPMRGSIKVKNEFSHGVLSPKSNSR